MCRRYCTLLLLFGCCPKDTADCLRLIKSQSPEASYLGFFAVPFPIKTWENVCSAYVSSHRLILACSPVKLDAEGIRLSSWFLSFGFFSRWSHGFSIFSSSRLSTVKAVKYSEDLEILDSNFILTIQVVYSHAVLPILLYYFHLCLTSAATIFKESNWDEQFIFWKLRFKLSDTREDWCLALLVLEIVAIKSIL